MDDPFPISPRIQERLTTVGLEFEAEFYGAATHRQPDNLDALVELGHVYTRMQRYGEGLQVDQELARLMPEDATVQYNLACSLALMGRIDPALDTLERAVSLGYDDPDHLLEDEDMRGLWNEPRLRELVRLMQRVPADPPAGN
ncbi:MAG: tetratricopeptide repeat protein [Planctomycetota bacterium]|jgi:tetratricopeptide (TPR) repeat protein|nr:tetratricopeptide repeat protein [Planctomycetota bacterium]